MKSQEKMQFELVETSKDLEPIQNEGNFYGIITQAEVIQLKSDRGVGLRLKLEVGNKYIFCVLGSYQAIDKVAAELDLTDETIGNLVGQGVRFSTKAHQYDGKLTYLRCINPVIEIDPMVTLMYRYANQRKEDGI